MACMQPTTTAASLWSSCELPWYSHRRFSLLLRSTSRSHCLKTNAVLLQISKASSLQRPWSFSSSSWFQCRSAALCHLHGMGYLHPKTQWTSQSRCEALSHSQPFCFSFRRYRIIVQSITPTLGSNCEPSGVSDSMKDTLKIFWMSAPGCCKWTLNPRHGKKYIPLFTEGVSGLHLWWGSILFCKVLQLQQQFRLRTMDWCSCNHIYWHWRVQVWPKPVQWFSFHLEKSQ